MNKIVLYLLTSFIFFYKTGHSQCDSLEKNLFRNDRIKPSFILITPTAANIGHAPVPGLFVNLNIPKEYEILLLKMDSAFWINHLNDENEDWACNLILYYLYQKDASAIAYIYNTREKWLRTKEEEIRYWKLKFKGNGSDFL